MTPVASSVPEWATPAVNAVRGISRGVLLAVGLGLIVALTAIYLVSPRMQTAAGVSPDPARQILTPFYIANHGSFAWREVHTQCIARSTEFDLAAGVAPVTAGNTLHVTNKFEGVVAPGQRASIDCSRGLVDQTGSLRYADFDLNVCLKPYPLIDYISLVHFRYVGERGRDGTMHWAVQPVQRTSIPWMYVKRESDQSECEWAE